MEKARFKQAELATAWRRQDSKQRQARTRHGEEKARFKQAELGTAGRGLE